jgi:integrase
VSIEKKPDGRYQVRWRDPAGKQRARLFDRKIDATNFEATVTVDMSRGAYVDPNAGRETVGAYAARWAESQPWRASTRANRAWIIEQRIVPTFGAVRLQAMRPSDVQSWVGRMSASGGAASSVEAYYRVLSSIMKAARADRLIHESPCVGVKLPRADVAPSSLVPLTVEQVHELAGEVPGRYRALVLVSAGLGLRQAEACALTVDRVDFLRRKVQIDRQVVSPGKVGDVKLPAHFGPPKTPSSNRVVPLPSVVGDALAAHLAEYGEGPARLIFTASTGTMISRQTWHGAFSAAATRVGIDATSHDLRHHAASLLIASGCSPKAVASFLGHKNASETLNTYAHLWPSDEDRITAAIDAGLRPDVHEMCIATVGEPNA